MPKRDLATIRAELEELLRDLVEHDSEIRHVDVSAESGLVGKHLREMRLPKDALIISIRRGRDLLIPDGATILAEGDRVTLIGRRGDVEKAGDQLAE